MDRDHQRNEVSNWVSKLPGSVVQRARGTLADRAFCLGFVTGCGVPLPWEPPDKCEIGRPNRSAVELGDLITADDLDEEGALRWLGEGAWRKADLPALVKIEVENLLATRIPLAG
jgi:hypothetical protein